MCVCARARDTSTELNYLISPKTYYFFRFMEAPGVLSYHYPLYLCRFYACCLEFFVVSIIYIDAPEGCQHGTNYHSFTQRAPYR